MKMELYDTWILDDVELNICVRILGYSDWYHIEIEDNGEALEGKMLEGFIKLAEKGLLQEYGNLFQPTVQMRKLILPLAAPDKIIQVYYENKNDVYFQKESDLIKVEQLWTEKRSFRFMTLSEKDMVDLLDMLLPDFYVSGSYPEIAIFVLNSDHSRETLLRIFEKEGCIWLSKEGQEKKRLYSATRLMNWLFDLEEQNDIN